MDVDSVSDLVSESDGDEVEDHSLWEETEQLLQSILLLHEEATRRMQGLQGMVSRVQKDWIHICHEESLVDVKKTGQVSFGERLLQKLHTIHKD